MRCQFGSDQRGEQVARLHHRAHVHVHLVREAGHFGENRYLLIGLKLARELDHAVSGL
jgi:hypothetical protein